MMILSLHFPLLPMIFHNGFDMVHNAIECMGRQLDFILLDIIIVWHWSDVNVLATY